MISFIHKHVIRTYIMKNITAKNVNSLKVAIAAMEFLFPSFLYVGTTSFKGPFFSFSTLFDKKQK